MMFPNLPITKIKTEYEDNKIESKFDNGTVQTRRKFTRTRKTFNVTLASLEIEQTRELIEFYESVETYGIFEWKNDENEQTYKVRFSKPLKFSGEGKSIQRRSIDDLEFKEC